jgi:hypothetical protein
MNILVILNIAMAIVVVVLFLSGNIGLALIALFAGALIALKLSRARRNTRYPAEGAR